MISKRMIFYPWSLPLQNAMVPFDKLRAGSAHHQDLTPILEKDKRVKFAYLFGSAAWEEQNSLSDIDIAVYLREDCDPAEAKLDIIGKLMDLLGRGRFDLVILNTAPLPLAARVIRCRKVLADRDPFSRHRYESRILREYFDFSILEDSILNRRFAVGR